MLNGDAVMELLNVVEGSRGGSQALLLRHNLSLDAHDGVLRGETVKCMAPPRMANFNQNDCQPTPSADQAEPDCSVESELKPKNALW